MNTIDMSKNCFYAGIDLHKNYSYVTIMNYDGYVEHHGRYEHTDCKLISKLLSFNTPIKATLESTYGWYWMADDLDKASIPFLLAHPTKVNDIVGKKKTDKQDSKVLADLLRTNLLPTSYITSHHERFMKELLRYRMYLVNQKGDVKRKLHDILAKQNIHYQFTDILGVKAVTYLKSLNCPSPYREEINSLLNLADSLTEQIQQFTEKIETQLPADKKAELLMTIPGIGKILALTLTTEIGDITRFPNDRALASYAGVVPSVKSSGDKTYYGKSGFGNPYIRWALAEALVHITREGQPLHSFYETMKEKKGTSKARVAVMNKTIRIIYSMLTKNMPYMSNMHTQVN